MISLRQTLAFVLVMITLIIVAQAANAGKLAQNDRILLRNARVAFEKKDFKKAQSLYQKIPQSSDFWPEALEERAWTHVHLKEHDQALASVKTLFAPPFKNEIGAEPYLLSALIQLRLCNYNELFKVMKRFKEDVRPRFEAMQALAKTGESESSIRMLGRSIEAGQMSRVAAGPDLSNLPRLFYRDAKAKAAFASMLKPGASDRFSNILKMRLKALAQRDVKDVEAVLRKMHLVEVEAASRIYSEQHLADLKKSSAPITRDANTLVFPDDDKDIWLDELNSYQVDAKGCPSAGSSSPGAKGKQS